MLRRIAYGTAAASLLVGGIAVAQNYNLPPTYGEVTLTTGFAIVTVELEAGGPIDAATANLGEGCLGTIADAPDYRLQFTAGMLPLVFSVTSAADTTLLVNAPDGTWHCNDDTNELNPEVVFDAPQTGQYDIWVGTYVAGEVPPATLTIAEGATAGGVPPAGGLPPAGATAPDFNLPPTYGETTLTAGFNPDPATVQVIAGGEIDAAAANLGAACVGFIAAAPDYRVQYTPGALPLIFHVVPSPEAANADTTLVVNGPDGTWYCNDDTNGPNPQVVLEVPAAGQYDIWVGTYNPGMGADAVLHITEIRP
jgi:hypothetical protein